MPFFAFTKTTKINSLIFKIGSFFEESDSAVAFRQLKMKDPRFNVEDFMEEARRYIVPEILEAYLKGDAETLKIWCSEAV